MALIVVNPAHWRHPNAAFYFGYPGWSLPPPISLTSVETRAAGLRLGRLPPQVRAYWWQTLLQPYAMRRPDLGPTWQGRYIGQLFHYKDDMFGQGGLPHDVMAIGSSCNAADQVAWKSSSAACARHYERHNTDHHSGP